MEREMTGSGTNMGVIETEAPSVNVSPDAHSMP